MRCRASESPSRGRTIVIEREASAISAGWKLGQADAQETVCGARTVLLRQS